jgi:Asp-tRNA(Asn)/Glu-tRNA(Gln) amidotransferase A subunit family amidase
MEKHTSRRSLFKVSGALAARSLFGGGLVACGGGRGSSGHPLEWTAVEAIGAIKEGRVTAEAYVVMLLDRAEAQKDLNSLITLDKAGALTAARHVDAIRKAGMPLPVLAGLPIVVKDNINTSHLPTTDGTPALRNVQPATNAPSLQRLMDAGAIVLGKANIHELALGVTSTNLAPFAGPVKNPYDKTRIAGGSSGGTAAAIAARIVPADLGTDTGGSTRVPAALCGIAGLRPSVGNGGAERRYTDTHAVVPISHTRDTVGPMGRTVADIAPLDAVITGNPLVTSQELSGLLLGIPTLFWEGVDTEVARIMSLVKEKLIKAGVVFVDVTRQVYVNSTTKCRFKSPCMSLSTICRLTLQRPV